MTLEPLVLTGLMADPQNWFMVAYDTDFYIGSDNAIWLVRDDDMAPDDMVIVDGRDE